MQGRLGSLVSLVVVPSFALAVVACGAPRTEPGAGTHPGNVTVEIKGLQAASDVTRVVVSAEPAGVAVDLVAGLGEGIWAGALELPGGMQTLVGRAFAGPARIGESDPVPVHVQGDQPIHVTLTLKDVTGPPPPGDSPPTLAGWVVPDHLDVGQTAALAATARDFDGDPIAFRWSAAPAGCGTFTTPVTMGRNSASGRTSSVTFRAAVAGPCTVSIEAAAGAANVALSKEVAVWLPVMIDGVYVPHPLISTVEFIGSTTETITLGSGRLTTGTYTTGVPITVRVTWDETPWLARSAATLEDACGGAVIPVDSSAANESFSWTPTPGSFCTLTARVERYGLVDTFPVVARVAQGDGCTWTPVAVHDLASAPDEAIVRLSGMGGQGPAPVAGRTAWLQTGDWNVLLVPHGLAASDFVFATEVDVHVALPTDYDRWANFVPFTTSDTSPGPDGVCQFLGGIAASLRASPLAPPALEWWSTGCPNVLERSVPTTWSPGSWHRLRVEGERSTCRYRVLLDGAPADDSELWCDPGGPYVVLYGSAPSGRSAEVAWSNLAVFAGSGASCLP